MPLTGRLSTYEKKATNDKQTASGGVGTDPVKGKMEALTKSIN